MFLFTAKVQDVTSTIAASWFNFTAETVEEAVDRLPRIEGAVEIEIWRAGNLVAVVDAVSAHIFAGD
jgi:hypothetical protein